MKRTILILLTMLPMWASLSLARNIKEDLTEWSKSDTYKMMLCAHRGNTAAGRELDLPESSIAALNMAVEKNIDMIEIDARKTSDGVVVNMHDASIENFTNGTGLVAEMTYEQLRQYNLKTPSGKISDEPVHSFREMLEAAKDRIYVFVDIKENGLAKAMYKEVKDLGMINQVVWYISSATKDVATALRAYDQRVIICPYASKASTLQNYHQTYKLIIAHTALDCMEPSEGLASVFVEKGIVPYANHLDWDKNIYPTDTPDFSTLELFVERGIGFIQSDVCDVIAEYAEEKGYWKPYSGIENTKIDSPVVSTSYYDLTGRSYPELIQGMVMIVKKTHANGTIESTIEFNR